MKEINLYCQKTKEPLVYLNEKYLCKSTGIEYPIYAGIIFLGYPKGKSIELKKVLLDSQNSQGVIGSFAAGSHHMYLSYPLILKAIKTYKKLFPSNYPEKKVAINVGCGGDPSSNILASLGFQTYALDIEPNSLFIQQIWDKIISSNLPIRIACDNLCLPFPNESVDLVFCKEFIHHIEGHDAMVAEISRVLKVGGTAVIIEPTLTHCTTEETIKATCHHYKTNSEYLISFKKWNLDIKEYYLYYQLKSATWKNKIASLIYKIFNKKFETASGSNAFITELVQKLIDGKNIWYLVKSKSMDYKESFLDDIEIIDRKYLTINESIFNNQYIKGSVEYFKSIKKEIDFYCAVNNSNSVPDKNLQNL